jgi:hypothetical protein
MARAAVARSRFFPVAFIERLVNICPGSPNLFARARWAKRRT